MAVTQCLTSIMEKMVTKVMEESRRMLSPLPSSKRRPWSKKGSRL